MIKVPDRSKLWLFGEESERLLFRKLDDGDFDVWLQFCADPEIMRFFAFPEDTSEHEKCVQWFNKIYWRYEHFMGGMNVLIDKKSGAFIGQCGLLVHIVDEQEELEIGYSLMPES